MTTLAQNGKPTQVKPATKSTSHKPLSRRVRWLSHPGWMQGVIEMRLEFARRTELFAYHISPIPCDFGDAFQFERLGGDELAVYHVLFESEQDHSCDCKGFVRHGHCKHVDACKALLNREGI